MHAMGPPSFPNSGWEPTGEYESYNLVGDNHNNDPFLDFPVHNLVENHLNDGMFLDFPVPETYGVVHHQNNFGVPISLEENRITNDPVVIKKLNHNANERNRRKKANSLFSSLRSCLPSSDQSKKLSIPQTVSRSLQYIPELQEEVKKLKKKKEELLVQISGQRERCLKPQANVAASHVSNVFATELGDNKVMVQISSSKIYNFSISNVMSGLEEAGFVIVDVSSSSSSQGEQLFYTLHLQVDKNDNYKLTCEELSQRVLYLYEGWGNSFK